MANYRDEARGIHREARWTFWKFLPLFLLVVLVLAGLGFGLNSLGLFGRTVVERSVRALLPAQRGDQIADRNRQGGIGRDHQAAVQPKPGRRHKTQPGSPSRCRSGAHRHRKE